MSGARAYGAFGEPVYMGLGFTRESGPTDLELKTFECGDGNTISYHRVRSYGPYSKRGPASAAVKWYREQAEFSPNYDWAIVKSTGWEFDPPTKR